MPGTKRFGQAYPGQGSPPQFHWGVDSTTHADQNIPDPDDPTTTVKFFDLVRRKTKRAPEFWGRYIGSQTDSFNLYPPEAQYLANRNCRIHLVYGGTTSTTIQTRAHGETAATNAINFITNAGLQVPRGKKVAIYCNIDFEWNPGVDFFGGWFDTLDANGYVAGVYGDTADPDFNTPFCTAYRAVPSTRTVLLWTFRPLMPCDILASHAPPFNPTRPSCPAPTVVNPVVYQYSINCELAVGPPRPPQVDLDLADGVGFEKMWVSEVSAWHSRLVKTNLEDWSSVYYRSADRTAGGRQYVCWLSNGSTEAVRGPMESHSDDDEQTWSAPTARGFDGESSVVDRLGSVVARGAGIDVYAVNTSQSVLGIKMKRHSFDGTAWSSATVLTHPSTTRAGIMRPHAFRKADHSTRALAWIENERRDETRGVGGTLSDSESFPWVDEGFYGKCGWCADPNCGGPGNCSPGGEPCSGAHPACAGLCQTAPYEKWGPMTGSHPTQDLTAGPFAIPSIASIRGIEVAGSASRTGFGVSPGYERPDLTNPTRFREANCTGSFGAPCGNGGGQGSQDDCTAADGTVTTTGNWSVRLVRPNGEVSTAKGGGDGAFLLGSPTDNWGISSPADVNSSLFKVRAAFSFGASPSTQIIKQQGTGSPPALPSGSISVTVSSVRVYYEAYGTLWYADLDANGNLTGITRLREGIRPSNDIDGRFKVPDGEPIVIYPEDSQTGDYRKIERVGGVWQPPVAFDETDPAGFDGQALQSTISSFSFNQMSASRKQDESKFIALRHDVFNGSTYTHRDSVSGDQAFDMLADVADNEWSQGQPVNFDAHSLAQWQTDDGRVVGVLVTDDSLTDFDIWCIYHD